MIDFDDSVPDQPSDRPSERSSERPCYNRKLTEAWSRAEKQYTQAGAPFGPSVRALEVWIEYGRTTTIN